MPERIIEATAEAPPKARSRPHHGHDHAAHNLQPTITGRARHLWLMPRQQRGTPLLPAPAGMVPTSTPPSRSGSAAPRTREDGPHIRSAEDPLTAARERTWSIWRGYERVTHLTGVSTGTQSKTVTVYMRGMHGDRVLGSDGKTPDVTARRPRPSPASRPRRSPTSTSTPASPGRP